jgi:hypothetical protein
MSDIALRSILAHSNATIYIGHVHSADILDLPSDPRILYVNLDEFSESEVTAPSLDTYSDYSTNEFYKIVMHKWRLFDKVFEMSQASFLLYVDLDVIWFSDVYKYVTQSFSKFDAIDVLIQDATDEIFEPALCMGVLALRRTNFTYSLINKCAEMHREKMLQNSKIGDDTVITEFFEMGANREKFLLLPQKTFPVGNLASAFYRFGIFPGLQSPFPYIFHANYVVGVKRKVLLMFAVGRELNKLESFNLTRSKRMIYSTELILRGLKFRLTRFLRKSPRTNKGEK